MTKSKNKAKENPQNIFVFFKTVISGDVQFENKTQLIELMKNKFRIANSQIVLDWMIDNKFVSIESGKIELLFDSVEFKICKSIAKGSESFRVNTRQSQSLKRKQKEIKPKVEKSSSNVMFDFGKALLELKAGNKVSRSGWNSKGMFLQLVEPYKDFKITDDQVSLVTDATLLPWIGMKTADNKFVPWLASQTDVLSEDWGIVK